MHKNDVRYHGWYTESHLEGLVKERVYPPSIKCSVFYSSPRDFERLSLETFNMTISGTSKHHVFFPIKLYTAFGESKHMTSVHIQKQFVLLYFIMQNNTPYCMMFSFAAVLNFLHLLLRALH